MSEEKVYGMALKIPRARNFPGRIIAVCFQEALLDEARRFGEINGYETKLTEKPLNQEQEARAVQILKREITVNSLEEAIKYIQGEQK